MNRLNLVLLLALVASALYLVRTAYEGRRLYSQLDSARTEQAMLDAEDKRLDAERQAQATHLRVERMAREKLHMRTASPAVTIYATDTVTAGAGR